MKWFDFSIRNDRARSLSYAVFPSAKRWKDISFRYRIDEQVSFRRSFKEAHEAEINELRVEYDLPNSLVLIVPPRA